MEVNEDTNANHHMNNKDSNTKNEPPITNSTLDAEGIVKQYLNENIYPVPQKELINLLRNEFEVTRYAARLILENLIGVNTIEAGKFKHYFTGDIDPTTERLITDYPGGSLGLYALLNENQNRLLEMQEIEHMLVENGIVGTEVAAHRLFYRFRVKLREDEELGPKLRSSSENRYKMRFAWGEGAEEIISEYDIKLLEQKRAAKQLSRQKAHKSKPPSPVKQEIVNFKSNLKPAIRPALTDEDEAIFKFRDELVSRIKANEFEEESLKEMTNYLLERYDISEAIAKRSARMANLMRKRQLGY